MSKGDAAKHPHQTRTALKQRAEATERRPAGKCPDEEGFICKSVDENKMGNQQL